MDGGEFRNALQLKCPKCRKADLFYFPILKFRRMYTMKDNCSCCGQKYMLEPGFFYGAMFLSYIMSSFFMLISFFVLKLSLGLKTWDTFGLVLILMILMYFYVFRVSRSIWLHFFLHYDPTVKCQDTPL